MSSDKKFIRQQMTQSISSLSPAERLSMQKQLQANIIHTLEKAMAAVSVKSGGEPLRWGSYQALSDEAIVEAETLARFESWGRGVEWVFPKVISDQEIIFVKPKSFVKGEFGVSEPVGEEVSRESLFGVLIPGRAFSLSGQRLGRGKAFYDRFLTGFSGVKYGIAYDLQIVASLPAEQHDQPVDAVITEKQVIMLS